MGSLLTAAFGIISAGSWLGLVTAIDPLLMTYVLVWGPAPGSLTGGWLIVPATPAT